MPFFEMFSRQFQIQNLDPDWEPTIFPELEDQVVVLFTEISEYISSLEESGYKNIKTTWLQNIFRLNISLFARITAIVSYCE